MIICGTDFSPASLQAARAAAMLAAKLSEPLLLVHAIDERPGGAAAGGIADNVYDPQRRRLHEEAQNLRKHGADVRDEVVLGPADEALGKRAEQDPTSMIVVAAHGHRGWFLGNAAARIAQTASVPVLVVRDPTSFESAAAPTWSRWLKGQGALRVLVAVDFGVDARPLLAYLGRLRAAGSCDVLVVHAASLSLESARRGIWSSCGPTLVSAEIEAPLLAELRAMIPSLSGDGRLDHRIVAGYGGIDQQVAELALAERADLVVVGAHRRSRVERIFHGSVANGLLNAAQVSVACVPLSRERLARPAPVRRYRRILAAVDADAGGGEIMAFAVGLVERGGSVRAIHVRTRRGTPAIDAELEQRLRMLVPPDALAAGVEVTASVLEAPRAAEAICEEAERCGAEAVVIGSRASGMLGFAVIGSVTQGVLLASRRPVIVVHEPVAH
jgi:nucleotide-binding universal stress UspA family protein